MKIPSLEILAPSYTDLFTRCAPLPGRAAEVNALAERIASFRARYEDVAGRFSNGLPWFAVALIHAMEADLDFGCHLHNGDSLARRTVNVPAGRPISGNPPYAWSVSAIDALKYDRWDAIPAEQWQSVAGVLYHLEAFNGWGSRLYHQVPTPYLWAASNIEVPGKYVADGKWNGEALSAQIGAAVILKQLVTSGAVAFAAEKAAAAGQSDNRTIGQSASAAPAPAPAAAA